MAIHGWYVFVVMDDLVTFRGRTRQLGLRAQQFNTADPASLSLGHTCIYHIPSRAIDPPERRLLRKMHLIYSSPKLLFCIQSCSSSSSSPCSSSLSRPFFHFIRCTKFPHVSTRKTLPMVNTRLLRHSATWCQFSSCAVGYAVIYFRDSSCCSANFCIKIINVSHRLLCPY